jgi:hypothetical protein
MWDESSAMFAYCVDLTSIFEKVSFKYCPREANKVVHELSSSFSNKVSSSWVDEPPGFILFKLINNVTIIAVNKVTQQSPLFP